MRRRIYHALTGVRLSLLLMIPALLLVACGESSIPRNIHNACLLLTDRPAWRAAVEETARRWKAPVPVQLAIIWRESQFQADARPPRRYFLGLIPFGRASSAYGYAQAIDGTWEWYKTDAGRISASRTIFADASDFVGWYMNLSKKINGIPLKDARRQYLAYHEGHTGYRRKTFRKKPWLIQVAKDVEAQKRLYEQQLKSCTYGG